MISFTEVAASSGIDKVPRDRSPDGSAMVVETVEELPITNTSLTSSITLDGRTSKVGTLEGSSLVVWISAGTVLNDVVSKVGVSCEIARMDDGIGEEPFNEILSVPDSSVMDQSFTGSRFCFDSGTNDISAVVVTCTGAVITRAVSTFTGF